MKKIRLLLLFLIVIISISNSLYGQIKNIESSSFTISRENFKNDFGSNWDVIINEKTGLPRMIKNGNTKRYVGNPKEAALTFLNEYRDLFGMKKDLTDLVHQKTITNKYGLSSITFQQFYENILVEEAQIKVHQFKDGRIGMANGFYYPNITISTIPKYPLSQAIEKVKNDIPLTSEENFKTNLIILPTIDGGYNLTWKINIFNENPFIDVLYFVDAFSGVIIEKRDLSMHVTGTGNVYPTHPNMSSITTKDLYRLNGTGYLEGTYVKVLNDTTVEAYSVSNNFQYSYSSTHFDEVNLYYHVDDFRHNFIETLGSPQFTQITAHAHSVSSPGPNSAWFSPTTGDIYFGTAPSGILNDFAKEDKVIYHEYSHAVFYDIQSGVSANSGEEGAIREGVPDYLAGAYTGRPIFGDYSNPNYQRDMSNPAIESYSAFDNTFPVQYKAAEFFSSVLWDIRNQTGISNSESDFLVFDALSIISGNPNFLEFRDAMILADEAAYSGSHKTLIYKAFADRGIGKPYSIFSGNINSPTNWTGLVHLNGNVNVYSNLTIEKGTDIWLDSNVSLSIHPSNGKLVAEGTETEPIRFIRGDADNDWNRISLLSSAGNSIKWTLFDGGYINLSIASKNNVIEHSTFRNATHRTIEGWHNQDGSGNASATISHSLIENSGSVGIVAQYLDLNINNTTIQNNNQDGLHINSATVFPFYQNLITNNGLVISSRDGDRITSSGTFYMLGSSYDEGYNEISDNANNQIENYGDTIVGAALSGSGGYNSVKGNYSGSNYLVANYGSAINSVGTWWGQTSTDPAMFTGSVSGTHLTFDPTSTPGNDGESPAKAIFREDINFNQLFDEAEEALSNATNSDEIQHRFHHLYQLEGLANKSDITDRFQDLTTLATQEINSPFTAQSLTNTYRELAVILHTKSLIRNENYSEAQSYLDEVNYSELSAKNHREYVDLRLVTETYHGKYETALATLDELYALHQAKGEHLEEVQSRYAPIREDILVRLKNNDRSPLKETTAEEELKDQIDEFTLHQNYPNPFNPVTNISYTLPERGFVSLNVYDILGRKVADLVNEVKSIGTHSVNFDASFLSSGIYMYKLEAGQKVLSKRMTLIK